MLPRARRRAAALAAIALLLTGCSIRAPEPSDWVLTPVRYDNRMDGEEGAPDVLDVSYPMSLISDTDGGFWGFSSGSWLHLDSNGQTLQRFNTGVTGMVTGLTAASPTTLVIAESIPSTDYASRITAFDTETGEIVQIHRDPRPLGALAVVGEEIFVVAHSLDTQAMSIERMPLAAGAAPTTVVAGIDEYGFSALALGPDGTMYLATERDHYTFAPDGSLRERTPAPSSSPAVAVSEDGAVAWLTTAAPTPGVEYFVGPGSGPAQSLITAGDTCPAASSRRNQRLTITDASGTRVLPFLCAPHGFTWWGEGHLVVSVGTEGGAVLVDVAPPRPTG